MQPRSGKAALEASVGKAYAEDEGYEVRVLRYPRVADAGIASECEGRPALALWKDIRFVFAAQVGELEGVRATVFDLVLTGPGPTRQVLRMDADPGADAMAVAFSIAAAVGRKHCSLSVREVAASGFTQLCFADLEAYEEAARSAVPKE